MNAADSPEPIASDNVYNRVFWLAFIANLTMVTCNSMTFRFAELIVYLGGSEKDTGDIVQAGVFGAIASRFFLGQMLDRYGTRKVWVLSCLLFATACAVFFTSDRLSLLMYIARVAFATGLAGMSTAGIVHVQKQCPQNRRTEIIGNFGSSGFLGMALGSQIGDLLYRYVPDPTLKFHLIFGIPVLLMSGYFAIVMLITRDDVHVRPRKTPGAHKLILRYWPGMIVAVAMIMGVSFTVTTVFLTRMVTERHIGGIANFFLGYCASAFLFRVASSDWSGRFGRPKLLLMGMMGHAVGHALLAHATSQWHLIIPALCGGFGHAMLFPSVVSLGSGTFPREYRGTGTTIVLGFTELGQALSAPAIGRLIDYAREHHWGDPFLPMFYASAGSAVLVAIIYAWHSRGWVDEELGPITVTINESGEPVGTPVGGAFPTPGVNIVIEDQETATTGRHESLRTHGENNPG